MLREQTQREPDSSRGNSQTYGRKTPTTSGRGQRELGSRLSSRLDSDVRNATTTSAAHSEIAKHAAPPSREDAGHRNATSRKATGGLSDTTRKGHPAHRRAGHGRILATGGRRAARIKENVTPVLPVDADKGPETEHRRIDKAMTNKQTKHRTTRVIEIHLSQKDSSFISSAPSVEGETYVRTTFIQELDRYMACQLRLFNMDHYFSYGPWPLDFEEWDDFETATRKEIQGTTALGVTLRPEYNAKGDVGIEFNAEKWNMRTVQVGDKVVIGNSHPSPDYVFDAPVTSTQRGTIALEWKSSWGRLQECLPEHRSLCTFSLPGRFRADIHIEDISPGRVRSALDQLTCVWGEEGRDVAFITPLQAIISLQGGRT